MAKSGCSHHWPCPKGSIAAAQQKIPDKPLFVLSDAEYDFICKRDGHECVLRPQCQGACDTHLEFVTSQLQAISGDDSFAKLTKIVLAYKNRTDGVRPDDKWTSPNFWDRPVDPNKLRHVQRLPGWDEIDSLVAHSLPIPQQYLRRALLSTVTLIPCATGIGKTILLLSTLCKVNAVHQELAFRASSTCFG